MDEFAMGSSTENSAYKKTRNPWDLDARARRLVRAARRRRWPRAWRPWPSAPTRAAPSASPRRSAASYGLKPTYGRVSRYGLVAFASSLDQIGPLARTVEDVALAATRPLRTATPGRHQRP